MPVDFSSLSETITATYGGMVVQHPSHHSIIYHGPYGSQKIDMQNAGNQQSGAAAILQQIGRGQQYAAQQQQALANQQQAKYGACGGAGSGGILTSKEFTDYLSAGQLESYLQTGVFKEGDLPKEEKKMESRIKIGDIIIWPGGNYEYEVLNCSYNYQKNNFEYIIRDTKTQVVHTNCTDNGAIILNKKGIGSRMLSSFKEYFGKHKDVLFTVGIVLIVDHFIFGGAFTDKIKAILNKMLDKTHDALESVEGKKQ